MDSSISRTPGKLNHADRAAADRVEALREAWTTGLASGDAGPLDFGSIRAEARRELAARQS